MLASYPQKIAFLGKKNACFPNIRFILKQLLSFFPGFNERLRVMDHGFLFLNNSKLTVNYKNHNGVIIWQHVAIIWVILMLSLFFYPFI